MYVFCSAVSWLSVFNAKSCKLTASLNDKMTEVLGSFICEIPPQRLLSATIVDSRGDETTQRGLHEGLRSLSNFALW